MPKEEWPLACDHAVLLYNRIPHQKHDLKKSPYEIMYGVKPDMTKVKVFGCEVFELISKQSNTGLGQKLNPRAKAFMYVGHSETTVADSYKLYDRGSKTVKTEASVSALKMWMNTEKC
ncbi:uncharacterized protein MICPUCDRAFT_66036 [Micromonas pusilla CCMP1545]|uniref:Predicted protein n=1 Tax=Micromonas pusilla (strain CCMP1545) TaxID=564608 RepID=C1NAE7_MICPC|nr:uncharacterized protein MICPUCDRAFT_66036 [Micromonas pusilla CCMP1545]EEH50872.1 predicted protein [Micromonas pusilla CCMP1545]|eukprot:XP_003064892.1 predicted protein [Micromonas pusilla CCMP1545]